MSCDVMVIGGGPAGLSAAVNIRARGKTVLVVSNPIEENPLWRSERIDNYLGMPAMTGEKLLTAFQAHAEGAGAEFKAGRVLNAAMMGNRWYISIGSDVEEARAVVLAAGIVRGGQFPGEKEFLGQGVSYCATCDGMLYRGRQVAVLGWTESSRQEADFLRSIGCEVTFFEKPEDCRIQGDKSVESVTCDGKTVSVDGVFILRPALPPTNLFPGLAMDVGFVAVNRKMETNLPGLFAAGDCTGGPLQVSKAAGEGLIAGQNAAKWIDQNRRKNP